MGGTTLFRSASPDEEAPLANIAASGASNDTAGMREPLSNVRQDFGPARESPSARA
jgi:hypothetical protein